MDIRRLRLLRKSAIANKVAFLDRDGVLNRDLGYVSSFSNFRPVPGIKRLLRYLIKNDYALVIVTNQSGLARGYFDECDFRSFMNSLIRYYRINGIVFDKIFFCPHLPSAKVKKYELSCNCRKPMPGMLFSYINNYSIDYKNSFMIGDSSRDIEAGHNAGLKNNFMARESDIYLLKLNSMLMGLTRV